MVDTNQLAITNDTQRATFCIFAQSMGGSEKVAQGVMHEI